MRPGLVHRLDKDTSGILVIAKTEYSLNRLAKQVTVEMIVRGDIIDNNVLRKYATKLKEQSFSIDFTTSVAVPPLEGAP